MNVKDRIPRGALKLIQVQEIETLMGCLLWLFPLQSCRVFRGCKIFNIEVHLTIAETLVTTQVLIFSSHAPGLVAGNWAGVYFTIGGLFKSRSSG